jgi:GcrA cell cycle regulator
MDIEEEIKKLLPTGMSFQQIGKELGMTRNAIAGRVSRMRRRGELDNNYNVVVARITPGKPVEKYYQPPKTAPEPAPKPKVKVQVEPDADVGGVHLLDLREDDCRFPIGETARGYFFCGEPRRDHKTRYCAEHHTIVWVKGSAPKDRKPK